MESNFREFLVVTEEPLYPYPEEFFVQDTEGILLCVYGAVADALCRCNNHRPPPHWQRSRPLHGSSRYEGSRHRVQGRRGEPAEELRPTDRHGMGRRAVRLRGER